MQGEFFAMECLVIATSPGTLLIDLFQVTLVRENAVFGSIFTSSRVFLQEGDRCVRACNSMLFLVCNVCVYVCMCVCATLICRLSLRNMFWALVTLNIQWGVAITLYFLGLSRRDIFHAVFLLFFALYVNKSLFSLPFPVPFTFEMLTL